MGVFGKKNSGKSTFITKIFKKYDVPTSNPFFFEILKALKQEPCENAISREDALKLIYDFKEKHAEDRENHPINYGTLLDLIRLILELPSVEPKPKTGHWISVIERPPEEGKEVLVWYRYWRYGEYNNWYYTYGIGYQYDDRWSVIDGGTHTTVFAWRELPEPYKLSVLELQKSEDNSNDV